MTSTFADAIVVPVLACIIVLLLLPIIGMAIVIKRKQSVCEVDRKASKRYECIIWSVGDNQLSQVCAFRFEVWLNSSGSYYPRGIDFVHIKLTILNWEQLKVFCIWLVVQISLNRDLCSQHACDIEIHETDNHRTRDTSDPGKCWVVFAIKHTGF